MRWAARAHSFAAMDAILRREHAVAGGPWPGSDLPLEVASVECWHVKCAVSEAPHEGGVSSWGPAQHPTVVVRLTTADGQAGWGEAMGIGGCGEAVMVAIRTMVAPLLLAGRTSATANSLAKQATDQSQAASSGGRAAHAHLVTDIEATMRRLQQALHLQGRYGLTMFALSGVEVALWDLAAKAHGKPLCQLLRDADGTGRARAEPRERLPVYASLMRYGEPNSVGAVCNAVKEAGFGAVKLHEITEEAVAAARSAIGAKMKLLVDTNCPWDPAQAADSARWMKNYDVYWLEEPVYPPEDFTTLRGACTAKFDLPCVCEISGETH